MTIATGRSYLAIPGPTVIPDRVLTAMHRASPNIYEGEIVTLVDGIYRDLRRLVGTRHNAVVYIANGHGAWEAASSNILSRGQKVLLAATGQFSLLWADATRRLGIEVEVLDFGKSSALSPDPIAAALKADVHGKIAAVYVTHVDTASSAKSNLAAVRAAIDQVGHRALLVVDGVASIGSDELRMDNWGIDVLIGASQKGLMLPPGLGLVWFSQKAKDTSRSADLVTPYWDWKPRTGGAFYSMFGGTPPTQHLFGLRESLSMILDEEGLDAVWHRHAVLSRAVWAALDCWGKVGGIGLNMANPHERSHAVTAARIANGGAKALRAWLEFEAGVTLGIGLGMAPQGDPAGDDYLRVANMGHVNAHMTLGVIASMAAGMKALGIPHGPGALDAAADVIAQGQTAMRGSGLDLKRAAG